MELLGSDVQEGQFRLKDIIYNVTQTSLFACYQDMELILFPEVSADTEDPSVEYEMSSVRLYHNNGFSTHVSSYKELAGKKFVWTEGYNEEDEEAGTFYVQEHEQVRSGVIEILDADEAHLTIKWTGCADVGWSTEYGEMVPFETLFTVECPDRADYWLDAFKDVKMRIDQETQIELLNLEVFDQEVLRVSETREWEDFNTILEFRLTIAEESYPGTVIFTNGKNNYELIMERECPKKIAFAGVDYNLRAKYEVFRFSIG